jgi:hypothetical protein
MNRMSLGAGFAVALIALAYGGHASADVLLSPVAWVAAPTKADVDAAFPNHGARHEAGSADLQCQLEPTGAVSHCEDAWSSGMTFDRAALSLAPRFRASIPAGVPVRGERVWVELRFDFADTRGPTQPFELSDPEYVQAPGAAAAPTQLPASAANAGVKRALAVVDCTGAERGRLTDCAVVSETPAGMGIGEAALNALSTRRLNLWQGAEPVAGARVRIPFYIDAPDADADPAFTRQATFHAPGGGAGPYYPQEAEQKRIGGSATIECARQGSGALTDCVAISETPAGWHFMDAALKMAERGAITASGALDNQSRGVVRVTTPFRP